MSLYYFFECLFLAAIWGASFLFMRVASPELGPIWLIEFRVLVAGLALMSILARAGKLGELRRFWKPLLLLGIINSALPFVLLAYATIYLPALPFSAPQSAPSTAAILLALALALLSTAFAYILYFHLIQKAGASKALTVTYLVPLFAMIWSFLFLAEPITPAMIAGCAFILAGTAVANELFTTRSSKSELPQEQSLTPHNNDKQAGT